MPFQSIRILIPRDIIETVSDTLVELGALSITLTDAKDEPLLEPGPGELPLWQEAYLTALFEADASLEAPKQAVEILLPNVDIEIDMIADQVWERICLEQLKPMQFGKRLWVVPSTWEGEQPNGAIIVLDPGLAFGTGTHATTRMMLSFLDGYDCQNKTVVDFGCGSGILAVAATVLGASHVLAIDHDCQALQATQDNAIKNHCESKIQTALPNQYNPIKADVVLANIILEPLLTLHDILKGLLKQNGLLVLSGVLASQQELLLEGYSDFELLEVIRDEDWIRVVLRNL